MNIAIGGQTSQNTLRGSRSNQQVTNVPLLDVVRSNAELHEEIMQSLSKILETGHFIGGQNVKNFEASFSEYCKTEHAVACASGSDALLLALMAMDIGPGDEVIVPSFTFFATASAVWRLGAKPVFADIDPVTFNLDPTSVAACINDQTRAIIPVHLFGQCCDMESMINLANDAGIYVIEDAAQAVGATYRGQMAGSMGHVGCFSFYPTKNLGGMGDGGICTTNDEQIAERLRLMANHGMKPRYVHQHVGINSRLDAMQAAVLEIKLRHLDHWSAQRSVNAQRYHDLLRQHGLSSRVELPQCDHECGHVWNQYTIRVEDRETRDYLRQELASHRVGTEIYYPIPLHLQQCFASLGYRVGDFPNTEMASHQVLSLPIFPGLTAAEQQYAIRCMDMVIGSRYSAKAA